MFQLIAPSVKLGKDVRIFGFVNLYGCEIGDGSKIGTFVEIQKGASIGRRCKVSSHTFICEGVTLEDEVFVGHGVTFTNDLFPRAANPVRTRRLTVSACPSSRPFSPATSETLDGAERRQGWQRLVGPAFTIGFAFGLGYFTVALHWLGAAFLQGSVNAVFSGTSMIR